MCGGVRQRRLAITDLRVDLGAEADADEAFPGAGAGNRRASIIGEGAGADDQRVANPSRMLVGQSAGAGGRGEMAARVAGDRTDCAEGGVVVEHDDIVLLRLAELPGVPVGEERSERRRGGQEGGSEWETG